MLLPKPLLAQLGRLNRQRRAPTLCPSRYRINGSDRRSSGSSRDHMGRAWIARAALDAEPPAESVCRNRPRCVRSRRRPFGSASWSLQACANKSSARPRVAGKVFNAAVSGRRLAHQFHQRHPAPGGSTAFQPAGVAPSTISKCATSSASLPAVLSKGIVTRWRRSAGRCRERKSSAFPGSPAT
jgi:hypothetical protein